MSGIRLEVARVRLCRALWDCEAPDGWDPFTIKSADRSIRERIRSAETALTSASRDRFLNEAPHPSRAEVGATRGLLSPSWTRRGRPHLPAKEPEPMGYVARYLMACPDAALDRVIEAQDWCRLDYVSGGARCLVGHADDWRREAGWLPTRVWISAEHDRRGDAAFPVFGRTARRFGLPRAVQLVKQRAAKVLEERHPSPVRLQTVGA